MDSYDTPIDMYICPSYEDGRDPYTNNQTPKDSMSTIRQWFFEGSDPDNAPKRPFRKPGQDWITYKDPLKQIPNFGIQPNDKGDLIMPSTYVAIGLGIVEYEPKVSKGRKVNIYSPLISRMDPSTDALYADMVQSAVFTNSWQQYTNHRETFTLSNQPGKTWYRPLGGQAVMSDGSVPEWIEPTYHPLLLSYPSTSLRTSGVIGNKDWKRQNYGDWVASSPYMPLTGTRDK